jgi:hypothetical protein
MHAVFTHRDDILEDMKKLLPVLLLLGAIAVALLLWNNTAKAAIGNLNIYTGSAQILRGQKAVPGVTGAPVRISDVLRTADDSRVSVILRDGSVFRIEAGSEVRIEEIAYAGGSLATVEAQVSQGRMWWKVEPLTEGGNVNVETPTLVATVRGTSFDVSYQPGVSRLYVSTSAVQASLKEDRTITRTVTGGYVLTIRDGSAAQDMKQGPVPLPQGQKDDWTLFNEAEDAKLTGTVVTSSSTMSSSRNPTSSARSVASSARPASAAAKALSSSPRSSRAPSSAAKSSIASSAASVTLTKLQLAAKNTTMLINETNQLTLTATYSDGTTSTKPANVRWKLQPETAGGVDSGWRFKAVQEGKVMVSAYIDALYSNAVTITVQSSQTPPAAPKVTAVSVSFVKEGRTQGFPPAQFTAIARYDDGHTEDVTTRVTWSISGTAKGTITQSGYYTATNQGSDTVSAVFDSVTGSATINMP